ncbi:MAG TPA: response regulator transcription factor [Bryobacteraceae bacterium]|nr:response regulator transcription factor [Bryobacteraceae bacterium]
MGMLTAYTVALFSDEPLALGAVKALVEAAGGLRLVAAESQLGLVVAMVQERRPDVFLLDLSPDVDLSIVREIRQVAPETKLIVWTRGVPMEVAWQAVELGVRGILLKTLAPELMIKCMQRVGAGELWLDTTLTTLMLTSRPVRLTPRESQLVMLLARGLKNKEIAAELNISEGTVKVYLSKLFEKVGAKDRFELALFGLKNMSNLARPLAGVPQGAVTMRSAFSQRTA